MDEMIWDYDYDSLDDFTIEIHSIQGDKNVFNVKKNTTIGDLASKYKQSNKISKSDTVRLLFKGKTLEDQRTLVDYLIKPNDILYALIRLKGC